MNDPFVSAYSALEARMKIVDVITNNLANSQTTGFKKDFGRLLASPEGFDVGTAVDLTAGDLVGTNNPLDVAIDGPGFFAVQTPGGVRYTRAGNFSLNENGDLVTKDGMSVLSKNGSPVHTGEGNVAIQDGGIVTVDGNETEELKIVTFNNPDKLEKEGFQRLTWSGPTDGVEDVPDPRVKSGFLEHSNVNAVEEMVHLMSAYRDFESVQHTLKTLFADMNGKLVQELGKLT